MIPPSSPDSESSRLNSECRSRARGQGNLTEMSITTAYSQKELPEGVADLRRQYGPREPRVALVFSSPKYDPAALSRRLREAFPRTCVAGCTTAGEIVGGKMLSGSMVAMFLDDDIVEDAASAVVENLSSGIRLDAAFSELERHFKTPVSELDVQKYVGLVLIVSLFLYLTYNDLSRLVSFDVLWGRLVGLFQRL